MSSISGGMSNRGVGGVNPPVSSGGAAPAESSSTIRPAGPEEGKSSEIGAKPEIRFQRDLSSFPAKSVKCFSDNQAIATDAKIALTMGVAAAGVDRGQFMGLMGGVGQTIGKYEQFLESMADFVYNTENLDLEIFSMINGAANFRLNANASIGSLGNAEGFNAINFPKVDRHPNEKDEDYNARVKREHAKFAAKPENRKKLAANLRALKGAVARSFGNGVHPMQQEFRATQFIATGIDLLEQLDEVKAKNVLQAKDLFKKLSQVDVLGDTENLKFMKEMQDSAYFMEFKLKPIDDAICDTIGKVLDQLDQLKPPLRQAEKDVIIDIMKAKLEASRTASFDEKGQASGASGMRGRTRAHGGNQARFYSDREKPLQSFAASRCSDIDLPFLEQLPNAGSDPAKVKGFLDAMQEGGAFTQGKRMATQTANFQTLPQDRVEILQEPFEFLQSALQASGIHSDRKEAIAKQLESESDSTPKLREQLRGIKFKDAQKNDRTVNDLVEISTDGEVKSKPSLGSIMKDVGLRTMCSVSGTTVYIVAGLYAHAGKEKTEKMLRSLKEFVDSGCQGPLSDDFKSLFLNTAMYMQSGQYHSAAEVLGGLYCAALTLAYDPTKAAGPDNLDPKDFDQIAPKFQQMWQALQAHPENFFPLSNADKASLGNNSTGIIETLQKGHKETVEERKGEGREILETIQERDQRPQQKLAGEILKTLENEGQKAEEEAEKEIQKLREDFKDQHGLGNLKKRAAEAPGPREIPKVQKPLKKKEANET
ncbi:MAG: hypothetical protein LBB05_01380 [Puniceicoccales bacterium]|jgi:hypothetical protein|nr:hypothetical protein [Puniceicoccales bacterium]